MMKKASSREEEGDSLDTRSLFHGLVLKLRRSLRTEAVVFYGTFVLVGCCVIPPLIFIVSSSLTDQGLHGGGFSLSGYKEILSDPRLGALSLNTLLFGVGSAAVGVVLGTVLAWLTERTDVPLKSAIYVSAFLSFAVPGMLQIIGWIFLLGPRAGLINVSMKSLFGRNAPTFDIFSLGGMIFVEGISWISLVFLLMSVSFRAMDPSLEEAAAMFGAGRWLTIRKITLRLALPGIISVLLLSFVRTIEAFEVPFLIGGPGNVEVLMTKIYNELHSEFVPNYTTASAYGVLALLPVIVGLYIYAKLTGQTATFATVTGKGFRPKLLRLGLWRYPATFLIIMLAIVEFLPATYIGYISIISANAFYGTARFGISFDNYRSIFSDPLLIESLENSLIVASFSATAATIIAVVVSWLVLRTEFLLRRILEQMASIPIVIPAIVFGIAILQVFLNSSIPVYGTVWIIVIAFSIWFIPYAVRYTSIGLLQLHRDLEDSAHVSGAGGILTFRKILFPLLLPALFGAWAFVFLHSIRELTLPLLLYSSHSEVASTALLDLWVNGRIGDVAAFGTVLIVCSVILASLIWHLSRRYGLRA